MAVEVIPQIGLMKKNRKDLNSDLIRILKDSFAEQGISISPLEHEEGLASEDAFAHSDYMASQRRAIPAGLPFLGGKFEFVYGGPMLKERRNSGLREESRMNDRVITFSSFSYRVASEIARNPFVGPWYKMTKRFGLGMVSQEDDGEIKEIYITLRFAPWSLESLRSVII